VAISAGYLLDTNIISILVRPQSQKYPAVRSHLARVADELIMLPVIAIAEIEFGMAKVEISDESQKATLRKFFADYPLHLGIDDNTIEPYSLVRAELWKLYATPKKRGHKEKVPEDLFDRVTGRELGIDERDILIASVAIQYNLILATADRNQGMLSIERAAVGLEAKGRPIRLQVADWSIPFEE
jgi:predicted nucleic acid-binding protein